jgi:RHS repeat-associated protein
MGQDRAMKTRTAVLTVALLMGVAAPALAQPPAEVVEYYHTDALGSVRAVTDQSGALVRRHDYFPFGEEYLVQVGADNHRFTGKERDAETGLDYFGARYYASRSGRFTSVDPALDIEAALFDPQRWNRYAYVRNNPLRFIDPDGRLTYRLGPITLAALEKAKAMREAVSDWLGGGLIAGVADSLIAPVAPATPRELADNTMSWALPVAMVAGPARRLSAVASSTADAVLESSGRDASRQITVGARALAKKLGHALAAGYESAFEGIAPTQANAEKVISSILNNPTFVIVQNGAVRAFDKLGRGVRFDELTGKFIGFLERSLEK